MCRDGDRGLGYALGFVRNSTLLLYGVGLDYDRTGSFAEYANLLVHAPVDYCLRHGIRSLDLGLGGLHQKLVRGARPEPVWSLLPVAPAGWSDGAAMRHNRTRAALVRMKYRHWLSRADDDRLARVATTGLADFTGGY